MWIAALVIAGLLITYSTWLYVQANPDSRLPWVGRAATEPSRAVMTRLVGIVVGLVGGTAFTTDEDRGWFGLGILLMILPTVILQTRHNARVKA